ncbi:hypothetical protein JRQ81_004631 [Phrynocephalus forsythii]|uniref:Uncharacterized protein n=1 Tax=Phrynocephalus forsythii TaxID=171643 RepID=A0A9Q0XG97_9SAUR|nr:hypothetical protein JRQ81_004631 [Phrynocephalus forsythii]
MEGMEVEPSPAPAAGGGGALRRSNSAPLLPGATRTPPLDPGPGAQRTRRCSVCLESRGLGSSGVSCVPAGVFPATPARAAHRAERLPLPSPPPRGEAVTEALGLPSGRLPPPPSTGTPSSALETLKRKGGLEVDPPPTKLFVAGVPISPPAAL